MITDISIVSIVIGLKHCLLDVNREVWAFGQKISQQIEAGCSFCMVKVTKLKNPQTVGLKQQKA